MSEALQTEPVPAGRTRELSPLLWLGLPIASLALCWLTPLLGRDRWEAAMMGETGLLENATVAFLIPAIVICVLVFLRRRRLPRAVGVWMLILAIGSLYFAGEEASWGQHLIGYRTPDFIRDHNAQGEFNIHNINVGGTHLMDNLGNNLPRQIMLAACVIGGFICPLALHKWRRRGGSAKSFWAWFVPTRVLIPASLLAAMSTVPEHVYKAFIHGRYPLAMDSYTFMALVDAGGEFKEYCYAMVILLYVCSIYLRTPGAGGAPGERGGQDVASRAGSG
ncbi:hypothetical protein LCGC14_1887920 [marine sediment metagenome]|uniref:Uncharacterized protein n=1 Tax=marine sediment metagenome TaxID=412755 RepID=A0A0F9IE78_9ZZZZ